MQFSFCEGLLQIAQIQFSKATRQNVYRQEEAWTAGHPMAAVQGDATTRHDTMQMGMKLRDCPHECRMQKKPICAPRYCGSAATDCRVSAVARNNRLYIWRLFWRASAANSAGRVNTTWKYSQSSSSACLFSNHLALAKDWHLGQWRSAHELYALRSWLH